MGPKTREYFSGIWKNSHDCYLKSQVVELEPIVKGPTKEFKSIELLSNAALRNNVFPDTKVVKPSMNG